LKEYEDLERYRSHLIDKCQEKQQQAHYLNQIFQTDEVMKKYSHLISLKLQEKLLLVAQCLNELKLNQNHRRIPYFIHKIIHVAPKVLPTDSQIFHLLTETVDVIKRQLLSEFHSSFESHLVKSEELISENDQKMTSWSEFLSTARDLIVSYSMVAILPTYFQDSTHVLCIETYKDCLDSAFTPLWGRFHFHLGAARESDSTEQIIWTFEYSKSFLSLLSELCASITSPSSSLEEESEWKGGLETLLSSELMNSFRIAAIEQIVEKSCRFLRAHVAECIALEDSISSESPLSPFVISLLDCSLDLDSHFYSLLEETVKKGSAGSVSNTRLSYSLPVSLVFSDHPLCRKLWLSADIDHFKTALLSSSHPPQYLTFHDNQLSLETDLSFENNFSFHYNALTSSSSSSSSSSFPSPPSSVLSLSPLSGRNNRSSRCYICVYECLYLFQLTCQRYSFLNRTSFDLFISQVIEPVVMSMIGFLWFYKRMNPALRELDTRGILPFYVKSSAQMEEYCGYLDTVKYAKELLTQLENYYSHFICLEKYVPSRMTRILKLLKQWILEMTRGAKAQYFTLEDVVTKVFVYCEQARIREEAEEYNPLIGDTSDLKSLVSCVVSHLDAIVEELQEKMKTAEMAKNSFVY
jgi:hypothetical protein